MLANILSNIRKNLEYNLYFEDVKILLNTLKREILQIAKNHSKQNNFIVIPREIEEKVFGGYLFLEYEGKGKIGGLTISGACDDLIEKDSGKFIIRDFKSFEYNDSNNDDPLKLDSKYHKQFMQICIYGIIFEQERNQLCESIDLIFFPNKAISYEFTEELRKKAIEFVKENTFEGFEGITFDFNPGTEEENSNTKEELIEEVKPANNNQPEINKQQNTIDKDSIGWINTTLKKPLQLIRGKNNRLEGYLYPKKASLIKEGYCVIVEKEDGGRIICIVQQIECLEESASTITKTHKEEHYHIKLNPVGEFTPKGYEELRPQTIIGGKIKLPTQREFYQYKNLSLEGAFIGELNEINNNYPYHLEPRLLYQSMFIGGVQGTGKTSALKYLAYKISQISNAPKIIILDNEGEYSDILKIPSTEKSHLLMEKLNINAIDQKDIGIISLSSGDDYCLSLKTIDPLDLPYLLRELSPISHDTLSTILYDIVEENCEKNFSFSELKSKIYEYIEQPHYRILASTKAAIFRALNSVSLKIFDIDGKIPINIISELSIKKMIIINSHELRDMHQRIVGLYLLALLHKIAMKGKENYNILLILDEIQRLLPRSKSIADSEYQKRILGFLDEIVHRGRKRNYGVIFATQSPLDISKDIIDLCNIKVFFQIHGQTNTSLKEYLDKEEREQLKHLSKGEAFIMSKGKHKPVVIKFPYIY